MSERAVDITFSGFSGTLGLGVGVGVVVLTVVVASWVVVGGGDGIVFTGRGNPE